MKVSGQDREITLTVHGRERTFSEKELVALLEKHFSNEAIEQVSKNAERVGTANVAQVPTEGEWFEVNPKAIDQSLFEKERDDTEQEETRQLIVEAFREVKNKPKYEKKFKIMMPKKDWASKNVEELKQLACDFGDHNADWVELALELAQRIYNGESWEAVCDEPDEANWYRLVVWKNCYVRMVGGSRVCHNNFPSSGVRNYDCKSNCIFCNTVPLVVGYAE